MFNAEGWHNQDPCPRCGSTQTITYEYDEGFSELECEACGFCSEAQELSDLARYRGELREAGEPDDLPLIPFKKLDA